MAETILAKMAVQIAANTAEFNKALNKTSSGIKSFQSNITKMAGAIGLAFGIKEVGQFAFEIAKLAGEAEGVSAAFNRLPNSINLMLDLKRATHDTVSELDLMKRSVQASNFGIALESLPKLLEFATIRAQQTGQSVDYLVDSIVTGIGRKSPLILDNLGISAVALKEKMNGVSLATASVGEVAEAVGKIAADNLSTMGEFSDNTSTKVQKLSASWENFKVAMGAAANEAGLLGTSLDVLSGSLDVMASSNLSVLEKIATFITGPFGLADAKIKDYTRSIEKANAETKKQEQVVREVDRAFVEFNGNIDAYGKAIQTHVYRTELLAEFTKRLVKEEGDRILTLEQLQAKLQELNGDFERADVNDKKKLSNIGQEIIATQQLISKLDELRKKRGEVGQEGFSTNFGKGITHREKPQQERLPRNNELFQPVEIPDPLIGERESIDLTLEQWQEFYGIKRQLAEEDAARMQAQMQTAADYGQAIGDSLGAAISGQKKFSDAMRQLTGELIRMFFQRALAGIISSAAQSGGPPPVAIALAAAGVAAISAMFSKFGASGGRVSAGGASVSKSSGGAGYSRMAGNGAQDSNPTVTFVIRGQDMWGVLNNFQKNNYSTKVSNG